MGWISDLVKHLSISKVFASAVFVTSTSLLFGGHLLPSLVPAIPSEWKLACIATMIFSGTYLLAWAMVAIFGACGSAKTSFFRWLRSRKLTERDEFLIDLLAKQAYETLNLSQMEFDPHEITRLEVIQHAKELQRAGLVRVSPHDDSIISLTENGKARAIEINKKNRANASAA